MKYVVTPIAKNLDRLKDTELDYSFHQEFINRLFRDFVNKKDEVIKGAFIKAGIDVNDMEFLKANITRVIYEGDKFEHFYYRRGTPEEKRIISIEKEPNIGMDYNDVSFTTKQTVTTKYY